MTIPRLCLFCEHFNYSSGDPGYSEYTPGYDADMSCSNHVWEFDIWADDLLSVMMNAADCVHFEINQWAQDRYGDKFK